VAMQLTADIFNLPATRLSNTEVCAAGAAINAGIWAGIYKDYEDGVASMMREHKTFYPIPQNVEIYERIYHDIYKKIYLKNKDLFKKLGEFGHFKSE
jgi:sugar (pentulose or hexulose) kinase